MRLVDIIEARRNPSQNSMPNGPKGALQILSKIKDLDRCGISMTSVPKLGINPRSIYNTPIGVYFYPAEHYISRKSEGRKLEYVDEAQYIQIFTISGNILFLSRISDADVKQVITSLQNSIQSLLSYGKSGDVIRSKINISYRNSGLHANNKSPGGKLWFILCELSEFLSNKSVNDNEDDDPYKYSQPVKITAEKSTLIWNKLIRLLGYSAVIDDGDSIIHLNEPRQGVVVDTKAISHVATVNNLQDPTIATDPYSAYMYATNIGKRFKRGEKAIAQRPDLASQYASTILKDPDPDTWAERFRNSRTR